MKAAGRLFLCLLVIFSKLTLAAKAEKGNVLQQLHLPKGFTISLFADDLPNARSLALGDDGLIFVGTRGTGDEGKVYAVRDSDGNGVADQHFVVAEKLNMPNGVAYKDGVLYVAEIHRIIRYDGITGRLKNPPAPTTIYDRFPPDRHHGWKYLRFGPDGELYTAVGVNCNICLPEKPIFGALVRLKANGGNPEILAEGIRNSVGFDWQPDSGRLFFNDNGRDYLGDDLPPEELNLWEKKGEHFGYPYCHAGTIADPEYGNMRKCGEFKTPAWTYKAHIAPLGMRFYTGTRFPEEYRNQLFVAQHGSWNRSQPQGYRVVLLKFKNGMPYAEQNFIDGWLTAAGGVLGRPVDILQMPDGSLLISDDQLGVIYRVDYKE